MGILEIASKVFKKGNAKDNNFLALALTPDQVLAAVWEFKDDQVYLNGTGQKPYKSLENLIHETAIAIDKAGQNAKSDVSKVVFGISQNWLQDGQLPSETSRLFKKLSKDLEIEPQAFIPLSAAVNHFLKIKEKKEPSAILLGTFDSLTEVHLLENSKLINTKIHKDKLTDGGIIDLIKSLKEESELPSTIYLYGPNASHLSEKLKSSSLKELFTSPLHFRVIENEDLLLGIAFAQAADILGHEPKVEDISPTNALMPKEAETAKNENELGFVEGEDILTNGQKKEEEIYREKVDEDKKDEYIETEPQKPQKDEEYALIREQLPVHTPKERNKQKSLPLFNLLRFPYNFSKIPPKKLGIAFAAFIFLLIITNYFLAQMLTKARVVVKVNPKIHEQEFKTIVKESASGDELQGHKITAMVSDSVKSTATGTKKTGESAKGQVKVFNWTISPFTFKKETVIISKDGIKFKLDSEVQVASRSSATPGQGDAPVVASEFGPSGNLPQGKDFTFQEFDELLYSARSDSAFSGGEERQATVVSKEDTAKLEKSLKESLGKKAKDELKSSNSQNVLLDETVQINVVKKEFDKKIDDEASVINLNMQIEASTIAFSEEDLKNYLVKNPGIKLDEGLQLRTQDIEIIELTGVLGKNSLAISGRFKAKQVPKINEEELLAKVAGKSLKETRAIIKEFPQVAEVEVTFSPSLPFINSLPKNKSRIQFLIEAT